MRWRDDRRAGPLWWWTLAVLVITTTLLTTVGGWLDPDTVPDAPPDFPGATSGPPVGAMVLLLDVTDGADLAQVRTVLTDRGASATLIGARSHDGVRTADYVDGPLDATAARVRAAGDGRAPVLLSTTFNRGTDAHLVTLEPGPGPVVLRDRSVVMGGSCPDPTAGSAIWTPAAQLEPLLDGLARCGLTSSALAPEPAPVDGRLAALAAVVVVASVAAPAITAVLLAGNLLVITRNLTSATAALVYRWRARRREAPRPSGPRAPVSVLVPAYNEEAGIIATLRSIVRAAWPGCEIIVVDDGSTDATARLVREAGLPMVTLIPQANGGKHTALNTALARARHELVVMVDGDTILASDALAELHDAAGDPRVAAISGNIKIANRCNLLTWWQHVEFVNSYNMDRSFYHLLGVMPTVPGALGLFRRSAIEAVGGLSGATVAEDTDLTLALQKAGFRTEHAAGAVAHTEAPVTVRQLYSQRFRWSFGTMQALWKHRRWSHLPLAARVRGRALYGYMLIFQMLLPFLGLVGDVTAIYLMVTDPGYALAVIAVVSAVQMATTALGLWLEKERLWPVVFVPLQTFFYRQFLYTSVIHAMMTAAIGAAVRWQKLRRLGVGHAALARDQRVAATGT